jgi:zinc D-Ala-D-Ala carboxypeptidase
LGNHGRDPVRPAHRSVVRVEGVVNLSKHFTLAELTVSQEGVRRGIDNTPSPEILDRLKRLAELLEEVKAELGGVGILISSGYRCPELNAAVGGSKNSAHMAGLAADFTAPRYGSVYQVARKIADSGIVYDQLIHEYGAWVHIGLAAATQQRQQNLSIFKGTGYLPGIVEKKAA